MAYFDKGEIIFYVVAVTTKVKVSDGEMLKYCLILLVTKGYPDDIKQS